MAKNHNHFGGMDEYMKEFARICVETGNTHITRNLERMLNSEVSIHTPLPKKSMLNNYKDLPREIDPLFLAQPSF